MPLSEHEHRVLSEFERELSPVRWAGVLTAAALLVGVVLLVVGEILADAAGVVVAVVGFVLVCAAAAVQLRRSARPRLRGRR